MQLVDGKSLRQLLDVQTRLSPELTIHIGTCVAAALDAAHQRRLRAPRRQARQHPRHADGRVLLTDFGIAKGLDGDDDLTSDNVMMGTAKYLSPEQVRGRKLDGRADLYSLGPRALRVPRRPRAVPRRDRRRHRAGPAAARPHRPRPAAPDAVPRASSTSSTAACSRNPNHRPATGAELRVALQHVAGEPPNTLEPDRADAPPPRVANGVRPVRQPAPRRAIRPPPRATGQQPRTRPGAPAIPGEATPPQPRPPTDPATTRPTAGPTLRGQPAKAADRASRPSIVMVCLLLAVGLVVSLILWVTIGRDDGASRHRRRTSGRRADRTTVPGDRPADAIAGVTSFDPERQRRGERRPRPRRRSPTAIPSTNWTHRVLPATSTWARTASGSSSRCRTAVAGDAVVRRRQRRRTRSTCSRPTPTSRPTEFADWGPALQADTTLRTGRDATVHVSIIVPARHLAASCCARSATTRAAAAPTRTAARSARSRSADVPLDRPPTTPTTALVAAAQAGDRRALDTLLRRHYDRVHAVCRRIAGSSRDADDAAQEAMICIVRGLARFDGRRPFSTWVYRIATNAALDELRRRNAAPALHVVGDDDGTRPRPSTRSPNARSRRSPTGWPSTPPSTTCPRSSAPPSCSATSPTSTTPRSPTRSASPSAPSSRGSPAAAASSPRLGNREPGANVQARSERQHRRPPTDHHRCTMNDDEQLELASAYVDGERRPTTSARRWKPTPS